MNLEVIDVYPLGENPDNGSIFGTMRVRLPDQKIDILGVFFVKKMERWTFKLPTRLATDRTGRRVDYPVIVFSDREMQSELMDAIFEKGPAFIEKRITDPEKPLIFPKRLPLALEAKKTLRYPNLKPSRNSATQRFLCRKNNCRLNLFQPRLCKMVKIKGKFQQPQINIISILAKFRNVSMWICLQERPPL